MSRTPLDVAIVGFANHTSAADPRTEPEMIQPVLHEVLDPFGLTPQDMGFIVSGSSDYIAGQPFSFVFALDSVGAWPPVAESHVEMDGAFALYEAWIRLQHGDIDTALVYAFGKASGGNLDRTLALQLDPYALAPLFPDATSLAALQARYLLDRGLATERDFAEVVARAWSHRGNGEATDHGERTPDDLLAAEKVFDPLRLHDCPPVTDGCAAIVLAAGPRARELSETPVWITGIDQRIEAHALGVRALWDSPSTRLAARNAGVQEGRIDVLETHAPYSPQQLIVERAIGAGEAALVNLSGGALVSNPVMATGLERIGWAARLLRDGHGARAAAHATAGPCLQQNLVCVLETDAAR